MIMAKKYLLGFSPAPDTRKIYNPYNPSLLRIGYANITAEEVVVYYQHFVDIQY